MSTIITVQRALVLKRTLLSGSATSGNKASAGLIKFNGLNDIYSINFNIYKFKKISHALNLINLYKTRAIN